MKNEKQIELNLINLSLNFYMHIALITVTQIIICRLPRAL